MRAILARFAQDENGATSIEYALMAGIIALGIIVSVSALPTALNGFFNNVSTNLSR
jgi:pilus assembly protein Flp/PilA